MFKSSTLPSDPLFVKNVPFYLLEGHIKLEQVMIEQWVVRAFATSSVVVIIYSLLTDPWNGPFIPLFTSLVVITILVMSRVSEYDCENSRKAGTPIELYSDGIKVYMPLLKRLRGQKSFIPKDIIASIEVIRSDSVQVYKDGRNMRLLWAPLQMKIATKDGREYTTERCYQARY